jgi:hypothetical protein
MRAKAGDAASKIADAARDAGGQAKQAASSLASDATQQVKGFLNMQVTAGADMVDHVVESARAAAESLDQNAPQLAGLVRNAAERAEEFSQDLRDQTVGDLIRTASDFTRKQPALAAVSGQRTIPASRSDPRQCSMGAAVCRRSGLPGAAGSSRLPPCALL